MNEHGVVAAWEQVITPVMVALGDRWYRTKRGIEIEHITSDAVTAALRAYGEPVVSDRRPVLLACVPDEPMPSRWWRWKPPCARPACRSGARSAGPDGGRRRRRHPTSSAADRVVGAAEWSRRSSDRRFDPAATSGRGGRLGGTGLGGAVGDGCGAARQLGSGRGTAVPVTDDRRQAWVACAGCPAKVGTARWGGRPGALGARVLLQARGDFGQSLRLCGSPRRAVARSGLCRVLASPRGCG